MSLIIIYSDVYDKLVSVPYAPPEVGGILGIKNEVIINCFFDLKNVTYSSYCYIPDVKGINEKIVKWSKVGIQFCGIFHSHPLYQPELSMDDLKYINQIIKSTSEYATKLYFPIILPKHRMISYVAYKADGRIYCENDNVKIIER